MNENVGKALVLGIALVLTIVLVLVAWQTVDPVGYAGVMATQAAAGGLR